MQGMQWIFALPLGLSVIAGLGPALAQSSPSGRISARNIEGKYEGRGEGSRLEATIRRIEDPATYSVDVSTAGIDVDGIGGRCVGSTTAIGRFNLKNRLVAVSFDQQARSISHRDICVLILEFRQNRLTIETNGCSYFHGTKCSFDGSLKYVASATEGGR
jgi:hypothetical protein